MLRRIEIALDGTFHVQVIGGAGDFQVTFGFNSFGTKDIRFSLIQTFFGNLPIKYSDIQS